MIDPRSPVIVGVGQAVERPPTRMPWCEPIELLERAVADALSDVDARNPLVVDTIAVADMLSWPVP